MRTWIALLVAVAAMCLLVAAFTARAAQFAPVFHNLPQPGTECTVLVESYGTTQVTWTGAVANWLPDYLILQTNDGKDMVCIRQDKINSIIVRDVGVANGQ